MATFLLRILFIGGLLVPTISPAENIANGLLEITGHAYDRETGEKLYLEHHYQHFKDGDITRHHVEYKRPDGTAIATKTLDYSQHNYAPDFKLQDWRDGYIEAASHTDKGYLLERQLNENSPLKQKLLSVSKSTDLVADSGFDRYVKTKLPTLLKTGSQTFELAVAGRLTSLSFEAALVNEGELFGLPAANIKVQPASLLRLLTDGIDITYALETGNLLRYEGISNIRDNNGERYDARIDFPPADRKFTAYSSHKQEQRDAVQRTAQYSGM